jgi:UDPglucose 6-dehydrogenase
MDITVIGTGYLGAVHAACMAELGHNVLGVDTDEQKISMLAAGQAPFFEPGLPELLRTNVAAGRLRFTTSLKEAAAFADVHFICVGTPQRQSGAADMSFVHAVADGLAPHLDKSCLLVGKSTVPVGTARALTERIQSMAPAGAAVTLAWNPEFLREGFAVEDTLRPDRLVVGVSAPGGDAALRELYAPLLEAGAPYIVTDLETSELIKVSANAFLATKISFINAISEVCEAAGADVVTVAEAIGYDSRIGNQFLRAGVGFGGGCLGKDIRAFQARAAELGVGDALRFLGEVDAINHGRRNRTVDLARELAGGMLAGTRVAVLGAAFKPNSDDVRDSPALHVAEKAHAEGALVRVHDPEAIENARIALPQVDYSDDIEKVLEGADVVLHLTDWTHYQELDPVELRDVVLHPRLVDGRNALDASAWQAAGWTVRALGRSL